MQPVWKKHVLTSSGYLGLGMFDDAALAFKNIEPEDKTRVGVLGARVALYMATRKWDMAAAVASHLVKVQPDNLDWWINLACAARQHEGVESAEAVLFQALELHHDNAAIEFNLAAMPVSWAALKRQRNGWAAPSSSMNSLKNWLSTTRTYDLCGIGLPSCHRLR